MGRNGLAHLPPQGDPRVCWRAMRIPTELGELYVEDQGSGPAVLLWHSFLHHGGMWRPVIERLRERFRLVSVDGPGHGRSSAARRPFDLDDCARAAEKVLDAHKLDRAAVLGLSWGGMVALTLAARRSKRISAIVAMDASARPEPLANKLRYHAMGAITRRIGVIPALLDRIEPLFFSDHALRERRVDLVEPWRGYVARMDRESIAHGLSCITERRDLTEALRQTEVPALVVVGSEDRARPPADSEFLAATIPGARLAFIPGAGHLSALERPDETAALVGEFLGRVAG